MATHPETLMFRVGLGVAMLVSNVLWFWLPQHAHASVGMAPNAAKVWANEFASATEDGPTPSWSRKGGGEMPITLK